MDLLTSILRLKTKRKKLKFTTLIHIHKNIIQIIIISLVFQASSL